MIVYFYYYAQSRIHKRSFLFNLLFYLYCSFPFLPSHPAPSLLFLLFFPISIPNFNNINPGGTHRIQKKENTFPVHALSILLSHSTAAFNARCPLLAPLMSCFVVLGPGSSNHSKQTEQKHKHGCLPDDVPRVISRVESRTRS